MPGSDHQGHEKWIIIGDKFSALSLFQALEFLSLWQYSRETRESTVSLNIRRNNT